MERFLERFWAQVGGQVGAKLAPKSQNECAKDNVQKKMVSNGGLEGQDGPKRPKVEAMTIGFSSDAAHGGRIGRPMDLELENWKNLT